MKQNDEIPVKSISHPVLLADENHCIIDANDKAILCYGYTSQEFLKLTLKDLQGKKKKKNFLKLIENIGQNGTASYETIHIKKGGDEFPVEVRIYKINIGSSKYYQYLINDISERKNGGEGFKYYHELMNYIIEHISSSVAVLDKNMRYIYVSQRWFEDYRIKEKEIIGRSHYEIFPDLPDFWKKVHQRALKGEIIRADEDKFPREDGTLDWVSWECRPWYEADNTVGGIVLYTEVITERKNMEISLKESQELFRTMFEYNPIPTTLAVLNKKIIVDINPAAEKLMEYKREEVSGRTVEELDIWADLDQRKEAFEILFREKKISNFELTYKTKYGKLGTALLSSKSIERLGTEYLISTFIDITLQKQANENILRSEEKFKAIFNNSPSAVALTSLATGKIVDINKNYEKLTGYSRVELIGKSTVEVGLVRDQKLRDQYFKKIILEGKNSEAFDYTIYNKKQEEINCLISGDTIMLPDGKYALFVLQDITPLKETQNELSRSEDRYRSTLDSMMEGAQIIGFDWRYVYINPAAEIHNRRPASELIGNKYSDMWPGIEKTEVYDVIKRCLEERISTKMENHFLFPNGASGWFDLNIQPVPEGVFILSIDITNKKEAALKETKLLERLDLATRSANIGVWDWDVVNNILVWDDRMYMLYGVQKEDFSGAYEAWLRGLHPEDVASSNERSQKALAGELSYDSEFRVLWPDGSIHYLKAYGDVFRDEAGKPLRMLGVNFDITDIKLAEQAIFENEERLNFALEQSHSGGWELDLVTHKAFRTNVHAQIFGYESNQSEWGFEIFFNHILPEDRPAFMVAFNDAVTGKNVLNHECRIHRKDGALRWIAIAGGLRKDSSGSYKKLSGIVQDITERKQAQEEILKLNEQLRDLIDSIKDLASKHDLESVQQIVTSSARKLTNAEGAALILREGDECLYAEINGIGPLWKGKKYKIETCLCWRVITDKEPVIIKNIYSDRKINITEYTATSIKSLAMVPIGTENPLGAIAVYWSNLFEASEIEIQLLQTLGDAASRAIENVRLYSELEMRVMKRTEELLDLYNNAPCGYHSLNQEGFFVRINDTELKWLGYQWEEIVNKLTFADVITEKSRKEFYKNFPKFKERGWISDLEFEMIRKDGSILPVLLSATAVYDGNGNYQHSRSTIIDHTDRKISEKLIIEANEKLKSSYKELEAFSYSVSHDLRAPLRAIDGYAKMIMEDYSAVLDSEGLRLLGVIVTSAINMGQLIDDLLSFSRISRQEIAKSNINMEEIAKLVLKEYIDENMERKISVKLLNLPEAYGDPSLIKQVWRNLISNAVKFSSKKERPEIEIGAIGEKEKIYYVKDNGVGFNMEFANKLFGVFQRLHSVKEYEGTGVGLAIVHRIITRHGGTIWVDSKENMETTFYFKF